MDLPAHAADQLRTIRSLLERATVYRSISVPGGLLGGLCALAGSAHWSAALWALCYGLALLATQEFAPRSLVWLGRTFFLAGMAATGLCVLQQDIDCPWLGSAIMATTFGGFHLAYAATVALAPQRDPATL